MSQLLMHFIHNSCSDKSYIETFCHLLLTSLSVLLQYLNLLAPLASLFSSPSMFLQKVCTVMIHVSYGVIKFHLFSTSPLRCNICMMCYVMGM